MKEFLEIKCLSKEEEAEVLKKLEKAIASKKKEGILTEREIREIAEMELSPMLDILDVQSVYENFLFRQKDK